MNDTRTLNKGINKDVNPLLQPKDTYRHALNVVQMSDSGDMYSLVNERGTELMPVTFPEGFKLIGQSILDREVIVFLADVNGYSQIGVISDTGYARVVPSLEEGISGDTNNELGLSTDRGISVVSRRIATGERVVYYTDGLVPMSTVNIDAPPVIGEIEDNTKVIPNMNLPEINFLGLDETSGDLPIGGVQLISRYKTIDLTATAFGEATNIIPLIDDIRSAGRNQYDGEYFDFSNVSKSINVEITGIDTSYTYLEMVAVRYIGFTNTIEFHALPLITITNETLEFSYDGSEEYTELTREEIREIPISYSTAKSVTQKDSVLFWSNLKDENQDIFSNMQTFFNDVTVEYVTKEFLHDDSDDAEILGYKDESYTVDYKGYMRDEVYSVGAVVNLLDGTKTAVFHIPGNYRLSNTGTDNFVRGAGTELGTFISNIEYPINQGYPGIRDGDDTSLGHEDNFIRHHKMPSLETSPHFIGGATADDDQNVSILGLKFTFNKSLPIEVREKMQSITIVRQMRSSKASKSIYAQGLTSSYVSLDRNYPYGWSAGNGTFPGFKKTPFFNQFSISSDSVSSVNNPDVPAIAFDYRSATTKELAFFSAESVLGILPAKDLVGSRIKPVLSLTGDTSEVHFRTSQNLVNGTATEIDLTRFPAYWCSCNYFAASAPVGTNGPQIGDANNIDIKSTYSPGQLSDDLDNESSSAHIYLSTVDSESALSRGFGSDNGNYIHGYYVSGAPVDAGTHDNNDVRGMTNVIHSNLCNIEAINDNQYGPISSSTFIPVMTAEIDFSVAGAELTDVFNGDTFINKFAYRNSDVYFYKGLYRQNILSVISNNYRNEAVSPGENALQDGFDFRSVSYFFTESTKNCDYRHIYVDRSDPDNPKDDGVNYYPHDSMYNTIATQPQEGDSTSYNEMYSFENNVKTYSTKSAQEIDLSEFPNRTVYSKSINQDEVTDSYRVYPVNNFYDLPKESGEIWSSFVESNALYLHTPKALWRTYANDVGTQSNDLGEVIMGTGAMFSNPSKRLTNTEGGYGGTISQWGAVSTPYGRVFADALQGKIFLMAGGQLKDISRQGMKKEFFDLLDTDLVSNEQYEDKPFSGLGILLGWDSDLERILVTKKNGDNSITYSYSFLTGAWVSEHSYKPNAYYTLDKRMYSVDNQATAVLYKHNTGEYGNMYGNVEPMKLSLVSNDNAGEDKVFDNIEFKTKSVDGNIVKPIDTFDTVSVRTDLRATGTYVMKVKGAMPQPYTQGEIWATYVKNKYSITIPGNAVVDEFLDVTDESNLDQTMIYKSRIKGDALTIELEYLNSDNYKFMINFISCIYRVNAN